MSHKNLLYAIVLYLFRPWQDKEQPPEQENLHEPWQPPVQFPLQGHHANGVTLLFPVILLL